jgi:Bax protein
MSVFERALIGFVAVGVGALFVAATLYPIDSATRSPNAVYSLPGSAGDRATKDNRANSAHAGGPTVAVVASKFHHHKYDMATIRAGKAPVPPLFLTAFPHDLVRIRAPETRKNFFFKMVLPLVLRVNDAIEEDRRRLMPLLASSLAGHRLAAEDRLWLAAKLDQYRVRRAGLVELARRMDTVPPSLAIAQAAEESGWGTSRFAREGNALFGQWTFAAVGGLVPKERATGKRHKIKVFQTLTQAVGAYAANLNTHRAYRDFRNARARMRKLGDAPDGMKLAQSLTSYSERGRAYVTSIQRIIRTNQLSQLDKAQLGGTLLDSAKEPAI